MAEELTEILTSRSEILSVIVTWCVIGTSSVYALAGLFVVDPMNGVGGTGSRLVKLWAPIVFACIGAATGALISAMTGFFIASTMVSDNLGVEVNVARTFGLIHTGIVVFFSIGKGELFLI
eukprot:GFYU01007565.1.p1 GENE.GFYU01007565.1~~GFYU01007565.1.p1  ORF type:complete len:121 (+),score=0.69 GFYU01007565.1:155-517(+)